MGKRLEHELRVESRPRYEADSRLPSTAERSRRSRDRTALTGSGSKLRRALRYLVVAGERVDRTNTGVPVVSKTCGNRFLLHLGVRRNCGLDGGACSFSIILIDHPRLGPAGFVDRCTYRPAASLAPASTTNVGAVFPPCPPSGTRGSTAQATSVRRERGDRRRRKARCGRARRQRCCWRFGHQPTPVPARFKQEHVTREWKDRTHNAGSILEFEGTDQPVDGVNARDPPPHPRVARGFLAPNPAHRAGQRGWPHVNRGSHRTCPQCCPSSIILYGRFVTEVVDRIVRSRPGQRPKGIYRSFTSGPTIPGPRVRATRSPAGPNGRSLGSCSLGPISPRNGSRAQGAARLGPTFVQSATSPRAGRSPGLRN